MRRYFIWIGSIVGFSVFFPFIAALITARSANDKGSLQNIYEAAESGQLVVARIDGRNEEVDVERFIPMVLMSRCSIDDEEEVLKAQAVIIRTEIVRRMQGLGSIDASQLNMEYVSYSSMEDSWGEDFSANYNYLMKIVNNTSCQVIRFEGSVIEPFFHEVSAGMTRDGKYRYLLAAESEGDLASEKFLRMAYYTNEEFIDIVKSINSDINISEKAPLETMQIIERDSSGYVLSLQIDGVELTGEAFAEAFDLASTYFQAEEFNGAVRIITKGEGHGYGLSMQGARTYAEAGQSYIQILNHYFSGVSIE